MKYAINTLMYVVIVFIQKYAHTWSEPLFLFCYQEGVLTIRSSLDHLDLSDKAKRESAKQAEDNQDMDEDDPGVEDQPGDIKPVTVRFAKSGGDSEKYKKIREKSYEFQQQKAR